VKVWWLGTHGTTFLSILQRRYNIPVEGRRDRFTLILLTDPGAPARHLQVPRAWPIFLGVFGALSMVGSLLIGREARAWFEPEREPPGVTVPVLDYHEDDEGTHASAAMPRFESLLSRPSALGVSSFASVAPPAPNKRADAPARLRTEPARLALKNAGPLPTPLLSGKALKLYDVNAKRSLRVTPFTEEGVPDPGAFAELRSFLRCRRSGHEMDMDPRLIAVLSRISQHFGDAVVQIISAHRKPDGVVTRETSQHAFGTAADIRIAGVSVEELKDAARALGAKGVGVYPKSGFVHVDVRKKAYAWRDNGNGAVDD
jgi:uncharacterized protein YcbK (DUF882 family)